MDGCGGERVGFGGDPEDGQKVWLIRRMSIWAGIAEVGSKDSGRIWAGGMRGWVLL